MFTDRRLPQQDGDPSFRRLLGSTFTSAPFEELNRALMLFRSSSV
jgi:hypothetical protein